MPLRLPRRSAGLRLLQRARDEAHRFAITYNRKRRSMRTVTSELLRIPGIGPKRRRELLRAFGSVRGVREAKEEEIAKLPGFSAAAAKRVLDVLNDRNPESAGEKISADGTSGAVADGEATRRAAEANTDGGEPPEAGTQAAVDITRQSSTLTTNSST